MLGAHRCLPRLSARTAAGGVRDAAMQPKVTQSPELWTRHKRAPIRDGARRHHIQRVPEKVSPCSRGMWFSYVKRSLGMFSSVKNVKSVKFLAQLSSCPQNSTVAEGVQAYGSWVEPQARPDGRRVPTHSAGARTYLRSRTWLATTPGWVDFPSGRS